MLTEAKRVLCGEVATARLPLCVEISLKTVEGDTMMLETWCLGMLPEQCDPSVSVRLTDHCTTLKMLLYLEDTNCYSTHWCNIFPKIFSCVPGKSYIHCVQQNEYST